MSGLLAFPPVDLGVLFLSTMKHIGSRLCVRFHERLQRTSELLDTVVEGNFRFEKREDLSDVLLRSGMSEECEE